MELDKDDKEIMSQLELLTEELEEAARHNFELNTEINARLQFLKHLIINKYK